MFCAMRDPGPTRIVFLVAFAVGYALYHAIRWYLKRPKVEKVDAVAPSAAANVAEPKEVGKSACESRPLCRPQPKAEPHAEVGGAEKDAPEEAPAEPAPGSVPDWESVTFSDEDVKHMMAMAKVAWSSGFLVEAHFWTTLARASGVHGLGARLIKMKSDWLAMGCPDESRNVHDGYALDRCQLAQAYMLFKCGIDDWANAVFILSCAEAGSQSARVLARYERLVKEQTT